MKAHLRRTSKSLSLTSFLILFPQIDSMPITLKGKQDIFVRSSLEGSFSSCHVRLHLPCYSYTLLLWLTPEDSGGKHEVTPRIATQAVPLPIFLHNCPSCARCKAGTDPRKERSQAPESLGLGQQGMKSKHRNGGKLRGMGNMITHSWVWTVAQDLGGNGETCGSMGCVMNLLLQGPEAPRPQQCMAFLNVALI